MEETKLDYLPDYAEELIKKIEELDSNLATEVRQLLESPAESTEYVRPGYIPTVINTI